MTIHPGTSYGPLPRTNCLLIGFFLDVSGRPHVLLMHERLIEYINTHEGVEWVTMGEMVNEFKKREKPAEGAMMPATPEEVAKKLGVA